MTRIVSPHMRWLVAVLMTVALPLCCCNGMFLSRALVLADGTAEHTLAQNGEHEAEHEALSHGVQTSSDEHHQTDPGCCPSDSDNDSAPCNSDSSCGCGQSTQLLALPDAPNTGVIPAAQIANVLPYIAENVQAPSRSLAIAIGTRSVLRSQYSLLGQHCAHIV